MDLVPGRACGECTACCVWLPIAEPAIRKYGGEPCRHLTDQGCGIYDGRPKLCRVWYCGWRYMGHLDEDWRPDRCNILVEIDHDTVPEGYRGPSLLFTLYRDISRIEWLPFLKLVGGMIEKDVACYLTVPVHMQLTPGRIFLNDMLRRAVQARDVNGLVLGLMRAALTCTTMVGAPLNLAQDGKVS